MTSFSNARALDIQTHLDAASQAQRIMGLKSVRRLVLPDCRLDSVPLQGIVQMFESELREIDPEIICTHNFGSLNIYHRTTHQSVMTACRPMPDNPIREIYTFEVVSSIDPYSLGDCPVIPLAKVDIAEFLEYKNAANEAYRIELRAAPHLCSLAHVRVTSVHQSHSAGVEAAEVRNWRLSSCVASNSAFTVIGCIC